MPHLSLVGRQCFRSLSFLMLRSRCMQGKRQTLSPFQPDQHLVTLYRDMLCAVAVAVPRHLVTRRVPAAALATFWTAGPRIKCPVPSLVCPTMFWPTRRGAPQLPCAARWSGARALAPFTIVAYTVLYLQYIAGCAGKKLYRLIVFSHT